MDRFVFVVGVVPFVGAFHLARLSTVCKDVHRILHDRFWHKPGKLVKIGLNGSAFVRALVSGKTWLSTPDNANTMQEKFLRLLSQRHSNKLMRKSVSDILKQAATNLLNKKDRDDVCFEAAFTLLKREMLSLGKFLVDNREGSLSVDRHSLLAGALFAIGTGIYLEPAEFFNTRTRTERCLIYALALYQYNLDS